jgi:isopenicillin N synthase-like dioxygenase
MREAQARKVAIDEIPIIDVSGIADGAPPAALSRVGDQIAEACERIGFFYAVGHGVPDATVTRCFGAAEQFFAAPDATRLGIKVNPYHRGYMPMYETTIPGNKADRKDSFDLALHLPMDDPDVVAKKPLHGPNQWPAGLPSFQADVERYYAEVSGFGFKLLKGFASALSLPSDFFQKLYTDKSLVSMRLIHYPPMTGPVPEGEFGAAAHTDYGIITILAQDTTGGLELHTRQGEWIAAPCVPNSFVINIGDLMAIWTNDRFKSMPHRVMNRSNTHRFSIPMFYNPHYDTVAACLPSCQSPENPPKYEPKVLGDYLVAKFDRNYAYRQKKSPAA